jgi:hypothetical protein
MSTTTTPVTRAGLLRLRWAVRLVLTIGVCASVAANVLHAAHHPVARGIAAWPPVALLLTVDLVSRVPVRRRLLSAVRVAATAVICGIAAYVSYGHMAAVATRYGESGPAAYLLPVSVDGLIVVASVCLVELSHHLAAGDTTVATAQRAASSAVVAANSVAGTRSTGAASVPATPVTATATGTATRTARPAGSAMFGEVHR